MKLYATEEDCQYKFHKETWLWQSTDLGITMHKEITFAADFANRKREIRVNSGNLGYGFVFLPKRYTQKTKKGGV
jgi:hypothetical protein